MLCRRAILASSGNAIRDFRVFAQPLAEADPAGWGIGWGGWPAGLRDNQGEIARFRRAA